MLATKFRRGFKAEAERIALELRAEIGLSPRARLDPLALAAHLLVPVISLSDLAKAVPAAVAHLTRGAGRSHFSAATVYVSKYKRIIITNPGHSDARRGNSLCHELSHIILEHDSEAPISSMGERAWNGVHEREAEWLGACLLIPGEAAVHAAKQGHDDATIAESFGVSEALATWRMRMTAARTRVVRARAYRRW